MTYNRKRNHWQNQKQKQKKMKRRCNETRSESITVDWAGLPETILEGVFERLPMVDCIAVGNVCKSWRDVFSPELSCWEKLGFPSLLMSGQKDREKRTCVSMLEKRAWEMNLTEALGKYFWGSVQDWLILVDNVECFYLDITLFNPFIGKKIQLPRVGDFYHKIVFSEIPSKGNSVAMLVGSQRSELKFWVPGAQSWRNTKLVGDPFQDAIFCGGSFFLLTKENDIVQIDVKTVSLEIASDSEIETRLHKLAVPDNDEMNRDGVLRYLVESCGNVLLVCRYFNSTPGVILETHGFKVFALDLTEMSWKRVEDLGDRVLFLGKCSSRSFSARELGGVKMANSIYFSNDNNTPSYNEWHFYEVRGLSCRFGLSNSGRKHWGLFRLGNKDNDKFCFRGDRFNFGPVWFTAPLWWYCTNFSINQ